MQEMLFCDQANQDNSKVNNFPSNARYLSIPTLTETISNNAKFVKDIKLQEK